MAREESKAGRWDRTVRRASLNTTSTWGLTLGDLRKVVAAAEGMGDEAEVRFEGLRKHYSVTDAWFAASIRIVEEVSDADVRG